MRREGLYSSLITDWRRQHRQGLLKAVLGRSDAAPAAAAAPFVVGFVLVMGLVPFNRPPA